MCQATVYLDDVVVMQDVMIVEPVPEGIRLIALFEPVRILPAVIRQIDLMKHRIILESLPQEEANDE
jgi:predicted RNA-binding protein